MARPESDNLQLPEPSEEELDRAIAEGLHNDCVDENGNVLPPGPTLEPIS